MPNVTWLEPQVLIDLLAINLYAAENRLRLPNAPQIAVVSPWLTDVEIQLRPGPWHQQLSVGRAGTGVSLSACLRVFRDLGWAVDVAVLAYGRSPSGLEKKVENFAAEVRLLRALATIGATLYQVPDLHAKGVVTPLGVITGSTNLTGSGLYAQAQNANLFAHNHPDYLPNCTQLLNRFRGCQPSSPP